MALAALYLLTYSAPGLAQESPSTDISSAQTLTTIHNFNGTDGHLPFAALAQATDGNLYGTTYYGGAGGSGNVFKVSPTGTLKTAYSFCSERDCADGEYSYAVPVQGTDGNFYGTTYVGGANDQGTVFKLSPSGTLTTLHSFDGTDGAEPLAGLVQATNGSCYGTTYLGGSKGDGSVFKVTPNGTFTTLHSFCSQSGCADGKNPYAALILGTDGNLYGTTLEGGAHGDGTVFKITPSGTLTTLHSFCSRSGCADGEFPQTGLLQASDGNFYGTTILGGSYGNGTIFKMTPTGTLTTLYNVCSQSGCPDGNYLYAGLTQATDGNLYGIMDIGGANGYGTIFKITLSGTLTTLYSFCSQSGCTDGANPQVGLVQATDGNFYGTTNGTVFKITPSGTLTTLYSFCSQSGCTDGRYPVAGLVQDTNGNFYGTTDSGGAKTRACGGFCGTVFSLSVGLEPFVKTQPAAARVGGFVQILGTNLTGATSVSFNGTPAVFRVVLNSWIKTTVPEGATTGTVEVVTPSGTLSSNVPFRVRP